MKITEQEFDPKLWDKRAIPTDADGQPLDPEHGVTFTSIDELGHKRFQRPDQRGTVYEPKTDADAEKLGAAPQQNTE